MSRLGNLPGVDVLPTSAVLNLPVETTPSQIASRLGVRFVVHGAVQMSKGQWRLSLEMFDAQLQRSCFTKRCDLDLGRLSSVEGDVAKGISRALNRPSVPAEAEERPRYSRDPMAYAEFMRGYRIAASGDASMMDQASHHLTNAVTRDPTFALAHATLSFACTTRHFEFDPASVWLEKAEFHCRRALEINANLPEGHVARAFLLWGPSKNFQHLEAMADLKRALALQNNLPHAYNRLGSILAHVGLLDHAREMFERGRPFQPRKAVNPSVVQVYVWGQEYERATPADSDLAGGESRQQVRHLFCSVPRNDDWGLERGQPPDGGSVAACAERTAHHQLARPASRFDGESRRSDRVCDQRLFEPQILRARASYVLSDRLHARPDRKARNCL